MPEFAQRQKQTQSSCLVSPAKPDRATLRPTQTKNPLLAQQQALGNQATQRFAESCPLALPSPSLCPFGGICHACPARVQAKLTINKPGDKYEQEANRVAKQVMRMPEPRLQRQVEPEEEEEEPLQTKPLADRITPLVQRQVKPEEEEEEPIQAKLADGARVQRQEEEPEEEEEEPIQTKPISKQSERLIQRQVEPEQDEEEEKPVQARPAEGTQMQRQEEEPEEEEEEPIQTERAGGQTARIGLGLEGQIGSLRGGGQPLPQSVRRFFEPRFGYDFNQVRIHSDNRAVSTAHILNAQAFTREQDIFFGAGRYQPHTAQGRRLLTHELVHTIQQTGGIRGKKHGAPRPSGNQTVVASGLRLVHRDLRRYRTNSTQRVPAIQLKKKQARRQTFLDVYNRRARRSWRFRSLRRSLRPSLVGPKQSRRRRGILWWLYHLRDKAYECTFHTYGDRTRRRQCVNETRNLAYVICEHLRKNFERLRRKRRFSKSKLSLLFKELLNCRRLLASLTIFQAGFGTVARKVTIVTPTKPGEKGYRCGSIPGGSEKYWQLTTATGTTEVDGYKCPVMFVEVKPGKSTAAALDNLFNNIEKWKLECFGAVQLINLRIWQKVLGDEMFDWMSRRFSQGRLAIQTMPHELIKGDPAKFGKTGYGTRSRKTQSVTVQHGGTEHEETRCSGKGGHPVFDKEWDRAPVGTRVQWRNHDPGVREEAPYKHENAIKTHQGRNPSEHRYTAFDFGIDLTEQEIKGKLVPSGRTARDPNYMSKYICRHQITRWLQPTDWQKPLKGVKVRLTKKK